MVHSDSEINTRSLHLILFFTLLGYKLMIFLMK